MGFMIIMGTLYNALLAIGFDIAPIVIWISSILLSTGLFN